MAMDEFSKMPAKERAMVLMAVLLDGMEAEVYLDSDQQNYKKHAAYFAAMQAELRMPYIGTLLRKALSEMRKME